MAEMKTQAAARCHARVAALRKRVLALKSLVPEPREEGDEEAEEAALKDGVQRFGVGNWAEIRENIGGFNAERRPVDLKDKWTNLKKRGDV